MHIKTDCPNPLVNQSGILARAEMAHVIDTAWEDEIVMRASSAVEPLQKSLARLGHDFELDGTLGFLLHDCRPISDHAASCYVTNLDFHDVTTAQLAVDRQIKKCPVAQSSMLVEKEPNRSNIARSQRTPLGIPLSVGVRTRHTDKLQQSWASEGKSC
jgi:hypothetical protein